MLLEIAGKRITLSNTYAPNEDDPEFFNTVMEEYVALENDLKIIRGDFNTLLDPKLDKKGGSAFYKNEASDWINNYMLDHNLVDIWRIKNAEDFIATWIRKKPLVVMEHLG